MKLKDRVAIVTGTSANIGGGIAEGLAAEGAAIVAVDANAANAKDCAGYLNGNGGRAIGVTCDVTDEAQVKAAVLRSEKAKATLVLPIWLVFRLSRSVSGKG